MLQKVRERQRWPFDGGTAKMQTFLRDVDARLALKKHPVDASFLALTIALLDTQGFRSLCQMAQLCNDSRHSTRNRLTLLRHWLEREIDLH